MSQLEPDFLDIVDGMLLTQKENIHTSNVGHIIGYDHKTQRAQVQIGTSKILQDDDVIDYPPLVSVPVKQPFRGGGYFICAPVNANDTGTIHFMENSVDEWLKYGGIQEPQDYRMHDISDAVFTTGVYHSQNPLEHADEQAFVMGTENAKILIKWRLDGSFDLTTQAGAIIKIDKDANAEIELKKVKIKTDEIDLKSQKITVDSNEINITSRKFNLISDIGRIVFATGDMIANAISLISHTHIGNLGFPTSAPTRE